MADLPRVVSTSLRRKLSSRSRIKVSNARSSPSRLLDSSRPSQRSVLTQNSRAMNAYKFLDLHSCEPEELFRVRSPARPHARPPGDETLGEKEEEKVGNVDEVHPTSTTRESCQVQQRCRQWGSTAEPGGFCALACCGVVGFLHASSRVLSCLKAKKWWCGTGVYYKVEYWFQLSRKCACLYYSVPLFGTRCEF